MNQRSAMFLKIKLLWHIFWLFLYSPTKEQRRKKAEISLIHPAILNMLLHVHIRSSMMRVSIQQAILELMSTFHVLPPTATVNGLLHRQWEAMSSQRQAQTNGFSVQTLSK